MRILHSLPLLAGILFVPVSGSADTGLAYVSIRDGNPNIYSRGADGVERQLTSGERASQEPAWSPDGRRVAFTSTRAGMPKVYTMDADGANQVRLTREDRIELAPSWAPDGSAIAYFSLDPAGAGAELRIANLRDGSEVVVKGNGLGKGPSPASWSADGRRLAFGGVDDTGRGEIWVVDRDGSDARIVSAGFNQRRKAGPALSPDGRKVVYIADTRPSVDVVVTDVESGESRNLTASPEATKQEAPRWSPDGKLIAFASTRGDDLAVRMDIFVMNADGSGMRNLTRHPHEDYDPRWAPDGRSIVFVSLRTGAGQLYSVDLASGETTRLTSTASHDMGAAPRPVTASIRAASARKPLGK